MIQITVPRDPDKWQRLVLKCAVLAVSGRSFTVFCRNDMEAQRLAREVNVLLRPKEPSHD